MSNCVNKKDFKIVKDGITYPIGIKAAGVKSGIRFNRKDLAMIYSEKIADGCGVFTKNKFKAAPLKVTGQNLSASQGKLQAVLINSGIANACTGEKGLIDAWDSVKEVAKQLKVKEEYVAVTSTGKIGEFLPMQKIKTGIQKAILELSIKGGTEAAEAILTTDTKKKEVAVNFKINGHEVRIGGMAKGSGMIHPNMATMLGFITSDISIKVDLLQEALKNVIENTFNMISVDRDTSTNDMVLLMANGLAGNKTISEKNADYKIFLDALYYTAEYLAKCMAKDGEGATKLIEVEVQNALTKNDAKKIAKSVVTSPLVKTAVFGNDPNWGRILAAVGYSGAEVDTEKIDLYLKEKIVENGEPLKCSRLELHKYLEESDEIKIVINLKLGKEDATAWGCDLTYDYVKINTKYS